MCVVLITLVFYYRVEEISTPSPPTCVLSLHFLGKLRASFSIVHLSSVFTTTIYHCCILLISPVTTHWWYTMVRKSQRLQKAYRKQYYKQNKDEESKDEQASVSKEIRKARNRKAYKACINPLPTKDAYMRHLRRTRE